MFWLFTDEQVRKNDTDTLKRWLRPKLDGYGVAIRDMTVANRLYRGVPWPERPRLVSEVSYPPARFARLNRASREGQPMFYASLGGPPVFFELRASAGQQIALSEWGVAEPLWMHNLGFHAAALMRLGGATAPARPKLTQPIFQETKVNEKMRRLFSLAFTVDASAAREYAPVRARVHGVPATASSTTDADSRGPWPCRMPTRPTRLWLPA